MVCYYYGYVSWINWPKILLTQNCKHLKSLHHKFRVREMCFSLKNRILHVGLLPEEIPFVKIRWQ